jgi:hypothetical protein
VSRYNRALTDEERVRIPGHAALFLAYLEDYARPAEKGFRTLVCDRKRMARRLGLTRREFACAEAYLNERHVITTTNLLPRNQAEAAEPVYRWFLPDRGERSGREHVRVDESA